MKNRDKNNLDIQFNLKSYFIPLQDTASNASSISDLKKLCGDGSTKCIYKCKSKRSQMSNINTELSLTRKISQINQKI